MSKRVILIVLDSFGVGSLPDAFQYGDEGANTFRSISHLSTLPNMGAMGLYNLLKIAKEHRSDILNKLSINSAWGKCAEKSAGKDTTTGHWEIAGHVLKKPFSTYPEGFQKEIIKPFEEAIGIPVLGNEPASGTEIIQRLGGEHVMTGKPIIYTSADSVFQIAAHESVIPLARLYEMCEIARAQLVGPHMVGRVIARPFIGDCEHFSRTKNRRDYSLPPPEDTMLDRLMAAGYETIGVGKIEDIFACRGLTQSDHTTSNTAGVDSLLRFMNDEMDGLIFVNLVDFDMLYGHRRDAEGYARALEEFDGRLPEIFTALKEDDLLMITADHGCDPSYTGTDHTREYVPALICGYNINQCSIGTRDSYADIAATVLDYFGISDTLAGDSFLSKIVK